MSKKKNRQFAAEDVAEVEKVWEDPVKVMNLIDLIFLDQEFKYGPMS